MFVRFTVQVVRNRFYVACFSAIRQIARVVLLNS